MADSNSQFETACSFNRRMYYYGYTGFVCIEGNCEKGTPETPRTRKQSSKEGIKLSKIHWINAVTGSRSYSSHQQCCYRNKQIQTDQNKCKLEMRRKKKIIFMNDLSIRSSGKWKPVRFKADVNHSVKGTALRAARTALVSLFQGVHMCPCLC